MGALGPDNPWMGLNVQSGHRKWGGVGRLYVLGPILSRERCSTGTVGTEKVPAGTFGGDSSIRFSDDGWWGRRGTVTHHCSLEFSEGSRNLRIFRAPFKILWVLMAGVCWFLCDYLVPGPVRVRALEQSTVTGTVCRVSCWSWGVAGPGGAMGDCVMCMRHNSNIHGHHWGSGINSRTRTC